MITLGSSSNTMIPCEIQDLVGSTSLHSMEGLDYDEKSNTMKHLRQIVYTLKCSLKEK